MLHACQLLFGCRNTFFVGCEGSFCAVSWLKDLSEVKFVDFPAAQAHIGLRSQIFGIGARLVAPLKLILYFFGNLQAERFSILKILKDFSRFNRILGLEAHRFFGHEVHHFMWGLRPILWLSEFKEICWCGQMTCVFEDQTCSCVLMHFRNSYVC